MAVHTDGRKNSVLGVSVTIFDFSGNSSHVDEIQSNTQRG